MEFPMRKYLGLGECLLEVYFREMGIYSFEPCCELYFNDKRVPWRIHMWHRDHWLEVDTREIVLPGMKDIDVRDS
jgi:hypothetical protein